MCCFFFNDTATTEIYTLSLHDALPICPDFQAHPLTIPSNERCYVPIQGEACWIRRRSGSDSASGRRRSRTSCRSEEHTSELQSRQYLVCRLLLEKKKHTAPECHHRPSN